MKAETLTMALEALKFYRDNMTHIPDPADAFNPQNDTLRRKIYAALLDLEAERAAPQATPAVMPDDVRATIEAALNVLHGTRLVDLWYHNLDQDIRGEPTDKVRAWLTLQPRDAADGPS